MRKRSKYKPKGVRLDVMSWVRAGFEVLDSRGLTLKIKNHAAMASIVKGTGTIADVDILITAMNIRSEERRVGKECRSRWSPYH